jgi:hypothetical protein
MGHIMLFTWMTEGCKKEKKKIRKERGVKKNCSTLIFGSRMDAFSPPGFQSMARYEKS